MQRFPSPPIKHGLIGRIFGHLYEIHEVSKKHGKKIGMGLYLKRNEWYQSADSKTIELSFMGKPVIICSDPSVFKEILGPKQDSFTNSVPLKKILGFFFPTSMFVVDGDQWQRIRKVAQKAMSKQSLDTVVPVMCNAAENMLNNANLNDLDTSSMMKRITFDGFHRVMYGWDPKSIDESPESMKILTACDMMAEAMANRMHLPLMWLWRLPTTENRAVDSARAVLKDFILGFVAARKLEIRQSSCGPAVSLLDAMILAAESGEDGGMTDQELYDQISGFFFGAYDTTSNTLLFLLNYLARHPEEQEALRRHLLARFPTRAALARATLAEVEGVAPLCHFVDEVNRLSAIAPYFGRTALHDVEVAGRLIPAGTEVLIDTATVGQEPAHWDGQADLDRFRPARWAERRPAPLASPMPFGFGGRICLGRKIALGEMRAFVAAVLLSHRVALRDAGEAFATDMALGLNVAPGTGNIRFTAL